MKNLANISIILMSILSSASLHAIPIHWDVELSAQPPQVFTLQRPRGETYELEAVLKRHGKPFEPAITNACIYWQTNGMENLYWSAPATVSSNCLRAVWLPEMDPGSTTVRGYIGDHGHIYAAAFQFRFSASPGAFPNELPLPTPVIDFSRVTVLNPPWSGGGGVDTNTVREIVGPMIEGHHDGTKLDARSVHWEGDYLVFGEGDVYHNISMHTGVIKEVGSLQLEIPTAISYLDTETGEQVGFDLSDVAKSSDAIKYTDEHVSLASSEWYIGTLSAGQFDVNGWDNLYSQKSETLPQYLASGEWNTADDKFARISDVLAVQIDTNALTQIGEMYALFENLPVDPVTGGVSVGALLAALAAAVAWLKKNKVEQADIDEAKAELDERIDVIEATSHPNMGIVGAPVFREGVVSGFSATDYLMFPTEVAVGQNAVDFYMAFTTGPSATTQQNLLDSAYGLACAVRNGQLVTAVSTTGTSFAGEIVGGSISANSAYRLKISFRHDAETGYSTSVYLADGSGEYVQVGETIYANAPLHPTATYWGGANPTTGVHHIFGGSINLAECRMDWNGKTVWRGYTEVPTYSKGVRDDGSPADQELHDFFTGSNGVLTETIDDRLPIPISAKSEGFTTESYKRFVVTVSGDMNVTLHTPNGDDAEIFECRFNGSSLAADASITFAGATATTMDTDCGTVTAGKVALMSAFWNGTTWDVNWKVEG